MTTRSIAAGNTRFGILSAISASHLLNDMMQSVIVAIYPLLQSEFTLTFTQIGIITLTYQLLASILQPLIGLYTDKYPQPYSLPIGMGFTFTGLLILSYAPSFAIILIGVSLVGIGSSVFHPESSRVARMASGGRHGLAQSFFQVGGNFGASLGPLLAAICIAPYGKGNLIWLSSAALIAMLILLQVSKWYKEQNSLKSKKGFVEPANPLPRKIIISSLLVLLILIFSKNFYTASISNFYTFYLMTKFELPLETAQIYLFVFLISVAAGTMIGGPVGDKIGRKYVIWGSILGVTPFSLMLPYVSLFWLGPLTVLIGLILSSAFSAVLVYAQELIPGKVGMISGLFFGLAFGMGGLGAALLGVVADQTSIETVYNICSFLPLLGIFAIFLPNLKEKRL